MSNNTTVCDISPDILQIRQQIYFILYYVITPTYFLLGTFGDIILFVAFKRQAKADAPYTYQLLIAVSEAFEIIFYTLSVAARKWFSGLETPGAAWFQGSQILMWYTAHLAAPLVNAFTTSSLLLSVSMAADRLMALSLPFKYKNFNHRLHHIFAAVTCYFIGVSTSIFDCFRFMVVPHGDLYRIEVDQAYVSLPLSIGLSHLRSLIRIVAVAFLIALNVAMTVAFQKRSRKIAQLTHRDQKELAKKNADKTLLLLTVWQSLLTCIGLTPLNIYYILAYLVPTFSVCWGVVMSPFVDAAKIFSNFIYFFIVITINKNTKTMVLDVFRDMKCFRCLR